MKKTIKLSLMLMVSFSALAGDNCNSLYGAYYTGHSSNLLNVCLREAQNGSAIAQNILGDLYSFGLAGLEQDREKAMEFYELSAKQNNPAAQYRLGAMYSNRANQLSDQMFSDDTSNERKIVLLKARDWYLLSAKQDYLPAIAGLGSMYYFDYFDYAESMKWLKKACDIDPIVYQSLCFIYDKLYKFKNSSN